MREGYDCNSVQTNRGQGRGDYSSNIELALRAQADGGESEDAMWATAQLLNINKGLIKKIALRFCDRGAELEDLMQIGSIGMIKAIRSFDADRGTCFSTYAVPLIFGEIRRYLRDEGPIKIGRYYKRVGAAVMSYRARILASEGRDPHISEIADALGISAEDAAMALDAASPMVSLSEGAYLDEDSAPIEEVITDEESATEHLRLIESIALREAIESLPSLWRRIVLLRYYRNMTQQSTAELLGITQVKVSREEKKIIERLRQMLEQT